MKINTLVCTICCVSFKTAKRSDTKYCSKTCFKENRRINGKKSTYYSRNREHVKRKRMEYYYRVKDSAEFKDKTKGYYNQYEKKRCKEDINFKLKIRLRSRLATAIKNNQKAGSAIKDLGCTIPELKKHLENQFQPGMTWNNWSINGWHIDHIKPLCGFDLTDPKQFKEACHYTNLQPLWAKDNISKNGKTI